MKSKTCYMILSHGRASNQITLRMLRKNGIAENVYIVIDNEDVQEDDYKRLYGNKVIVFDKRKEAEHTDTFDNGGNNDVVLFARNFAKRWAYERGYEYICLLDDDIQNFYYRYSSGEKMKSKPVCELNEIIELCISYMQHGGVDVISFGNDYDYIGGLEGKMREGITRKANGVFLLRTDSRMLFVSRFNEDVNTCYPESARGKLIFSVLCVQMKAKGTGKGNKGGMERIYREMSDYNKHFYSILCMPSDMKIVVDKKGACKLKKRANFPKILSGRYKK